MSKAGADDVENIGGWMTTITARVCLNMLRSRKSRREESFGVHIPDPIVSVEGGAQPEQEVVLADSVGLALLVVLDALTPAERLAFVLHDMFDLPFDEIAPMVDRTPEAARQLASRARRRVRGADLQSAESDLGRQREIVNAFFMAARGGNLDALVELLHPDVVLRADFGPKKPALNRVLHGAAEVAGQAQAGANPHATLYPAIVNGAAGVVVAIKGRPFAIMGFTIADGKIVAIDALADKERVGPLVAGVLDHAA
jgi:RNA polymerase sigma-70 factor (ECF subfamily)